MASIPLTAPISSIKGVGEKTEKLFQKVGVCTVSDILCFFPRTYVKLPEVLSDYAAVLRAFSPSSSGLYLENDGFLSGGADGGTARDAAVLGMLRKPAVNKKTRRFEITIADVGMDGAPSSFEMVWFRAPYMRNQLHTNVPYVFYGKLQTDGHGHFKMEQPKVYSPEDYEARQRALQPVYPLTKGLTSLTVQKTVRAVLDEVTLPEDYIGFLPPETLSSRELIPYVRAVRAIHFPADFEELSLARNRLVYDEFFRFFYHLEQNRYDETLTPNVWKLASHSVFDKVMERLPFSLTKGQAAALSDLRADFASDFVSQRMIQGDVGSGKTMVAFFAMVLFVENGYKAAIMAPTEVLARQHFETFARYLREFGLEKDYDVVCLTGSTKAKERREIAAKLTGDAPLFIIGTHALIQEKVSISNLGLVITDEQHRFGVKQRKTLGEKGNADGAVVGERGGAGDTVSVPIDVPTPHVVVMSATPIPRSLSMILYGDMRISVIKDMPANRKPIKNALIPTAKRYTAFNFIRKEVEAHHQAYIICPLVEESETTEAENVTNYAEKLYQSIPRDKIRVGILHGRMKPAEKNAIMDEFARGEVDVLISTTVVEVGVNVPNATVMMIEDAQRFGLAQLHQLRGRVGRGDAQSYCMFIDTSDGTGDAAGGNSGASAGGNAPHKPPKRLQVIAESNDGFHIANEDLKLRGPGDFFGIRQSGDFGFILADIYQDADVLKNAAADVKTFIETADERAAENFSAHLKLYDGVTYTNL